MLRAYWAHERPTKPWLFTGKNGNPLCHATARMALLKASAVAGIGKVVTPHMLRHSFAKNLINAGVGLEKVAALLGHSSVAVTQRYTTPSEMDVEEAVAQIGAQSSGGLVPSEFPPPPSP